MVILQPKEISQVKTIKQQALITRLLQSSYFSKAEFIELMRRNRNQIVTSYDASVLISYLISVLRFRKKFLNKKHKAHLKCDYCSSRKDLDRLYSPKYNAQRVVCLNCEDKKAEYEQDNIELQEANSKRLQEQINPVNEKQEASADLYRKYNYPGGDVDMKIDANYAAQDFDEEVERANEYDPVAHNLNSPQNKPSDLQ